MSESDLEKRLGELLPRMWRLALVLCGHRETAEDLVQAACVRALERREQFRAGSRLDSWVFTILSSIWKNHLRSEAIRRGNGLLDATEALQVDGVRQLESNILANEVLSKIGQLPEAQRVVVVLVYVEGFAYREAAEVLDIPIGTIMSRLAAARKTIAAQSGETARVGGTGKAGGHL